MQEEGAVTKPTVLFNTQLWRLTMAQPFTKGDVVISKWRETKSKPYREFLLSSKLCDTLDFDIDSVDFHAFAKAIRDCVILGVTSFVAFVVSNPKSIHPVIKNMRLIGCMDAHCLVTTVYTVQGIFIKPPQ